MKDEKNLESREDSAWFIGTLSMVAIVASAALVASVWFGMLGGVAK